MAPDGLVLALDQGSHASRAVLFDATGAQLAESQVPVTTRRDGSDRVTQDPEELARSLLTAVQDVRDTRRQPAPVAAGLATQRSTVAAWSLGSCRPLTEAISWQDRRNAAWLARLAPVAARVQEITGLPLSPHYGASKLRWYLDHVPAVQRADAAGDLALGPLSSFLVARLLVERPYVVDPANASRTLLYDPDALDWSPELLQAFGLDAGQLPRCVRTRHGYGHLTAGEISVPLLACTGDQSAAAFSDGVPEADCALVNVGTGAFVQRVAAHGVPAPAGLLRGVLHVDDDGVVASHEGTVNGAGSALEWLRERVALDVDRALAALADLDPAAGELPLFVNGVGGLGAPFWRSDFPSELVGEGSDSEYLAAVVESIAFLLGVNLERLRLAAPLRRLRISGGLARSDYLCRCLAAVTGLPVERAATMEATARGVAYLAAGKPKGWRRIQIEHVFEPSAAPGLGRRYARWRAEMERRGTCP